MGHVCYLSKAQTITGHLEVYEFMDILQQRPGIAAMFTVETKKKKKQKTISVKLRPSTGSMPTLIFPPSVAKSVGTAYRALSEGGRLTLTYRQAFAMHIFMPDVPRP